MCNQESDKTVRQFDHWLGTHAKLGFYELLFVVNSIMSLNVSFGSLCHRNTALSKK